MTNKLKNIIASDRFLKDIAYAYWRSEVLFAANFYRVFDYTKKKIKSHDIAKTLKVNDDALKRLLDTLSGMGLLEKSGAYYKNSDIADIHLVKGGEHYLGDMVTHARAMKFYWDGLGSIVKSGKSYISDLPDEDIENATIRFMKAMHDNAVVEADEFIRHIDVSRCKTLLDIGCGPAVFAQRFLKKNKKIHVTMFDTDMTIKLMKREYKIDKSFAGRVSFLKGDFIDYDFKNDLYDIVLLSNVVHIYGEKELISLLKSVYKAIASNGKIVLHDYFFTDDRVTPGEAGLFDINMLIATYSGRCYTVSEGKAVLEKSGFINIEEKRLQTKKIILTGEKRRKNNADTD